MRVVLAAALIAVTCIGCKSPPRPRAAHYEESEYAPYRQKGTGAIAGQVFMRQRGGVVVVGAGSGVHMNPVTSYSTEWFEATMSGRALEANDPRVEDCYHQTIADGDGRFHFADLAAGDYFIVSAVTWEVPGQWGASTQGGVVGTRVHVQDGKVSDAVLTR
jgi:hypothetical protein